MGLTWKGRRHIGLGFRVRAWVVSRVVRDQRLGLFALNGTQVSDGLPLLETALLTPLPCPLPFLACPSALTLPYPHPFLNPRPCKMGPDSVLEYNEQP